MSRRNWTRDELIVAFNLYCKLPFGQLHSRNPRVVDLAKLIGRTSGSVAMKLVNFAALDPTHRQRGVSGLSNTSKGDRAVWDEFNENWSQLAADSEKVYQSLTGNSPPDEPMDQQLEPVGPSVTERRQLVNVRLGQAFFRETVLASYGARCCVCVLPVVPLLVASHIVPWATRPDLRVNPRNGLCLCSLHDRAFDRGLIAVDIGMQLLISQRITKCLPDEVIEKMFCAYEGNTICLPEKFRPEDEFLSFHRQVVFAPA